MKQLFTIDVKYSQDFNEKILKINSNLQEQKKAQNTEKTKKDCWKIYLYTKKKFYPWSDVLDA